MTRSTFMTFAPRLALLALLAFAFAGPLTADEPAKAVPVLTVTMTKPETAQWPQTIVASGAIEAWQEASVGAQVGGQRIAEVRAEVGDEVKKGQVLARLDTALLNAELAELRAALGQAEASLGEANANRARAEQLRGRGALSEQSIQQLVTGAEVAEAQVVAARARVDSQRLRLTYTEIVAPDDGVITARSATLGAVTQVGEELFRMIRQERLEWRGELTAEQLVKLDPRAPVELRLPDGSKASATVRNVAPGMTSGSRLGLVYADIEPGSTARAGMYADGTILLPSTPALVVPASSIVIRDGRSLVFALTGRTSADTATIAARVVTPGRRRQGQVEIVQGLSPQDQVVDQGAGFLNDGDTVRVVPNGANTGSE